MAEEEAREKRIAQLQARARKDAANDAAAASNEETKYERASEPSQFISKSKNQSKAPKQEEFVPDFDLDEVPPLE